VSFVENYNMKQFCNRNEKSFLKAREFWWDDQILTRRPKFWPFIETFFETKQKNWITPEADWQKCSHAAQNTKTAQAIEKMTTLDDFSPVLQLLTTNFDEPAKCRSSCQNFGRLIKILELSKRFFHCDYKLFDVVIFYKWHKCIQFWVSETKVELDS